MATSSSLLAVVSLCLAAFTVAAPDQKFLATTNARNDVKQGISTKLLSGAFKDAGDTGSCPSEALSNRQGYTKTRRVPMIFDQPLKTIPQVLVSVTKLLAEGSKRLQYEAQALDVTTKGFTLEYKVFSDVAIDNVEVQWKALR